MKSSISLFVILLIIFGCSSEDHDALPAEFTSYIEKFVREAKARGVDLDVSDLSISFVTETTPPGNCGYAVVDPPRVYIKQSEDCWTGRTEIQKEILLFHEFGHALLRRPHINDTLPNGDFKSLMFDGNQFVLINDHTTEKWQYYLDELFDPSTPPPAWAAKKTEPTVVFTDSIRATSDWSFSNTMATNHIGTTTNTVFSSPGHSLSIQSLATGTGYSFWTYNWEPAGIPIGSRVVLRLKVRRVNVTGKGVYLAFRGDTSQSTNFFISTQSSKLIAGTQDFTEYSVTLNYYPDKVDRLHVFLILDGQGTGTVYFDDITLTSYQ